MQAGAWQLRPSCVVGKTTDYTVRANLITKVRKFGDASLAQQKTITILGDCLTITPDEFPDGMVRLYWPVIPIPGSGQSDIIPPSIVGRYIWKLANRETTILTR